MKDFLSSDCMYFYSGIKSIERTLNSKNNDSRDLVAVETPSDMNNPRCHTTLAPDKFTEKKQKFGGVCLNIKNSSKSRWAVLILLVNYSNRFQGKKAFEDKLKFT